MISAKAFLMDDSSAASVLGKGWATAEEAREAMVLSSVAEERERRARLWVAENAFLSGEETYQLGMITR